MTTSSSNLALLITQANRIASQLKNVSEGKVDAITDPAGKLRASLERGRVNFAIFMDDKIIQCEISWQTVRDSSHAVLSQLILSYMKGEPRH